MVHRHVAVIGCGVIGLASAIRLQEQGYRVTIFAREFPPDTTSNTAAAFWFTYCAAPPERTIPWSRTSFLKYQKLASIPESGVSFQTLRIFFADKNPGLTWADGAVGEVLQEIPPIDGRFAQGFKLKIPLIETPRYMEFLWKIFLKGGGRIDRRRIPSILGINKQYSLIVNCSGLGARELVNDETVFAIRGQVVRVRKPPNISPDIILGLEQAHTTYIVPREADCILGGTAEEHDWTIEPCEETTHSILRRCASLFPAFKNPEILEVKVGLRPGRKEVRFEHEELPNGRLLIHNYGHGGAGFTLCWGCADEICTLLA